MEFRTRHWATIALGTMGITAMITGQSTEVIMATVAGIGAMFTWDKIEKNVGSIRKQ